MSDPQGAAIVVFTPNPAMPSPERPAPPTPGTIGWHELYTTDLDGGFDFYSKLFGWTKVSDMDMGPMGVYRIFDEGDHKEMGDGGMMTKAPQIPVSCWNFYFNVDSIKAAVKRVESGGGKVSTVQCRYPAGAGSSTARTRREPCSRWSAAERHKRQVARHLQPRPGQHLPFPLLRSGKVHFKHS
jgi:predicted enzyme related to lactoylglutathione lyase